MKSKCLLLIAGLGLLGCNKTQSTAPAPESVKTAAQPSSYNLAITFTGLIGFAQEDGGSLWAFLVKADSFDMNHPETLPPGVLDDLSGLGNIDLSNLLPSHRAQIRFSNAKVVSGNGGDPTFGRPIAGDLTVVTGVAGPTKGSLDGASDAKHILQVYPKMPPADQAKIVALNELDSAQLDTSKLDPHLVARARIEAGTVTALIDPCQLSLKYSYAAGVTEECPKQQPVQLAERVVVKQTGITRNTITVKIGAESIELEPLDRNQDLGITILNDVDAALKSTDLCVSNGMAPHPMAFRWFYWLASKSVQNDTAHQYFPCIAQGAQRPPACPIDRLAIKPARKS